MIEMTITAQDPTDLKVQIEALARTLGLFTAPAPIEEQPVTQEMDYAPVKSKPKTPAKKHVPIKPGVLNGSQASDAQPGAPEPQGSDAGTPTQSADVSSATEPSSSARDQEPEQIVVTPPKEMLELKQKVIDALQAAFRAGKVQKVRDVLANYGGGAKSFREIDAVAFPVIDKAIQSGALN